MNDKRRIGIGMDYTVLFLKNISLLGMSRDQIEVTKPLGCYALTFL